MDTTRATIEVEQHTAEILKEKAEANGLSLDDYIRLLAESEMSLKPEGTITAAEIDLVLDELASGGEGVSPLPENFSREDIYFDHD